MDISMDIHVCVNIRFRPYPAYIHGYHTYMRYYFISRPTERVEGVRISISENFYQ